MAWHIYKGVAMKTVVRIEAFVVMLVAFALIASGCIYGAAKLSPPGVITAWLLIACKVLAVVALALEIIALVMRGAAGMALPCLILGTLLAVQAFSQAFGDETISIFGTIGMLVVTGGILFVCTQYKKEETYQGLRSES